MIFIRRLTTSGLARWRAPLYQTEITDIVRRNSSSGSASSKPRRPDIRHATLKRLAIPNPGTAAFVDPRNIVAPVVAPPRVERSVPLKAVVAQLNYNLFDVEWHAAEAVRLPAGAGPGGHGAGRDGAHDVALWNGNDTS